jgi:hypothetical protein
LAIAPFLYFSIIHADSSTSEILNKINMILLRHVACILWWSHTRATYSLIIMLLNYNSFDLIQYQTYNQTISLIITKAPKITRLNGFVSIFIHKRLRYFLPFHRNDHIVLQNILIARNHGFYQFLWLIPKSETENGC